MLTWCKDHSEEGAYDAIKCGHTYTNTVYKSFNERNLDYKCQVGCSKHLWKCVFFCFVSFVSFFYFLPFVYFLLFISLFELFIIEVLDKIWNLPEVNFIHYCTLYKITICKVSTNGWEIAFLLFGSYLKHLCTVEIGVSIQILIASIKTLVLVTD